MEHLQEVIIILGTEQVLMSEKDPGGRRLYHFTGSPEQAIFLPGPRFLQMT